MTSRPTNWVNCCSRCRVEFGWVELYRYKRAFSFHTDLETTNGHQSITTVYLYPPIMTIQQLVFCNMYLLTFWLYCLAQYELANRYWCFSRCHSSYESRERPVFNNTVSVWCHLQWPLVSPNPDCFKSYWTLNTISWTVQDKNIQCESKKFTTLRFSENFPKRLRIINKNFTRLLLVHTYAKLLNFI